MNQGNLDDKPSSSSNTKDNLREPLLDLSLQQFRRKSQEELIQEEINDHLPKLNTAEELEAGAEQRLFPVFNDFGLSIFSINYSLYIEFFYILIRILSQLFFLVVFLNILDRGTKQSLVSLVSFFHLDIKAKCLEFSASKDDETICENSMNLISLSRALLVRICYSLFTLLIAVFFQRFLRSREEARLINNPMLYDFNWTQDLFSVLIQNIPQDVTDEEEIKDFFNNLKPLKKVHGQVKEVIFIQDISKCSRLLGKINKLQKETPNPKLQTALQALKDELSQEEAGLPIHNGKAIVVFDSLRTRSVVLKLFRGAKTNFLEAFFRGYKTQTALRKSHLIAKAVPEPQNLNFESLCYPRWKKYSRSILAAFSGSILLFVLTMFTLSMINMGDSDSAGRKINWGEESIESDKTEISDSQKKMKGYLISGVLMIVQALQDRLFQAVSKIESRTNKTHADESWLSYSTYSSFFLYLMVQGFIISKDWDVAGDLAQTTILIFCAKYIAQKLGELFFCYHRVKNLQYIGSNKTFYAVKNYIALKFFGIDMVSKNFHFRFFKEASRIFPLIAMNFAFLGGGTKDRQEFSDILPITIPITIATLYIGALCDKYRLINQPEPCNLNSARFMLKLFKFLRSNHFAFWFGAMIWITSFTSFWSLCKEVIWKHETQDLRVYSFIQSSMGVVNQNVNYILFITVTIYLFYLFVWPSSDSLETKYDAYFEQHRSLVAYDMVAPHFVDVYKKPKFSSEKISDHDSVSAVL